MSNEQTNKTMIECQCQQWARVTKPNYVTNHHPNCEHYNDSLIDVWRVTDGTTSFFTDNQKQADEYAKDSIEPTTVTKEKMHREVFEALPEFEGF